MDVAYQSFAGAKADGCRGKPSWMTSYKQRGGDLKKALNPTLIRQVPQIDPCTYYNAIALCGAYKDLGADNQHAIMAAIGIFTDRFRIFAS